MVARGPEPLPEKAGYLEITSAQSTFEISGVDSNNLGRIGEVIQSGSAMDFKKDIHPKLEREIRQSAQLFSFKDVRHQEDGVGAMDPGLINLVLLDYEIFPQDRLGGLRFCSRHHFDLHTRAEIS